MGAAHDKVVLVTRRTRLEELVDRFGTRGQARFYLSHSGGDFDAYQAEDDAYRRALRRAFALWSRQEYWARVRTAAMRQAFGWDAAANRYVGIYEALLQR